MSDLRRSMPKVAAIVDRMRAQLGADWVDQCIKAAVRGQPDHFYAVEGGHIVGTPFSSDLVLADNMQLCFMVGGAGAAVRQPAGGTHGQN
jgi:hypothetical protein